MTLQLGQKVGKQNNMQLIDVLHYYATGVEYWTNNSQGELNSATLPHVKDYIKLDKGVQLHLRRLEDIRPDEAHKLVGLALSLDKRQQLEIREIRKEYIQYSCGVDVEHDMFGFPEQVEDNRQQYWFYLSAQQFHYLLSLHFDLFGLIESGQAVDIKEVQS